MEKPDWVIHYVQEHDCECCGKHETPEEHVGFEGFANVHTHGFNKHGHEEICVPFEIEPQTIGYILNLMGLRIRESGVKFEAGKDSRILADEYDVEFYKPEGSPVLYMLLPDPNNKFPGEEGCEFPYNQQRLYADIIEEDKGYV